MSTIDLIEKINKKRNDLKECEKVKLLNKCEYKIKCIKYVINIFEDHKLYDQTLKNKFVELVNKLSVDLDNNINKN